MALFHDALNARRRAARARANDPARFPVVLQWLRRDGMPSRMRDSTERFATDAEARRRVIALRDMNAGRVLRFSIDGVEA